MIILVPDEISLDIFSALGSCVGEFKMCYIDRSVGNASVLGVGSIFKICENSLTI